MAFFAGVTLQGNDDGDSASMYAPSSGGEGGGDSGSGTGGGGQKMVEMRTRGGEAVGSQP